MKKHLDYLFIDALENQLSAEEKEYFDNHLKNCPTCARNFQALQTVFEQTQLAHPPQPYETFWQHYWSELQLNLNKPKKAFNPLHWFSERSTEHYLKLGLAAAAILILSIGLYLGELRFRISDKNTIAAVEDIQQTAQSYLERSKILLTSFSNIEPGTERIPNFEQHKALSQKLIHQSAGLKKELDPSAQKRMLSLIDDLEVVLMQIANMDSTYDLNTIEMIQYSVEQKSVLFKLNLQDVSNIKESTVNNKDI